MNILFVCSQNKRRSLTAEKLFDGINGHCVKSAGTEKYSEEVSGKQIVTLNIPDDFEYMDEELQDILHSYVDEYI